MNAHVEIPVFQALPSGEQGRPSDQDLAPYRRLAMQLHHDLSSSEAPRSVMLVGPSEATMAAHASVTLASCMGEELRQRILLIDASARGELTRILGCADVSGFAEMLHNPELPADGMLLPTTQEFVQFLPAGNLGGFTRIHASADPGSLLRRLERDNELMVLSGGSVLNDTAALALAPFASCVLLVPVENETLIDDLDMAQRSLRFCKARKIGIVMASAGRGGR